MATRVANIRSYRYDRPLPDGHVYIGRPGHGEDGYFGNPYRLGTGENRGATINRFRAYATDRMETDAEYRERVAALKGKTLVCFCAPEPCHGDVLAELAESYGWD